MAATQEEVTFSALIEENRQLTKDLKVTQKLLETYRKCLLIFNTNCSCPGNTDSKIKLENLENFYDQYNDSKSNKEENQMTTDSTKTEIEDKTEQLFIDCTDFLELKAFEPKKIRISTDYFEDDDESTGPEEEVCSQLGMTAESRPKKASNGVHKRFVCEYEGCSRSFEDNYHLKRHVMGCHTFEKPFECQNCDKSFSRTDHLVKHVKNNHKNYKKWNCTHENCDFVTIFEDKYNIHESGHQINKCKFVGCDRSFFKKAHLTRHIKQCHS